MREMHRSEFAARRHADRNRARFAKAADMDAVLLCGRSAFVDQGAVGDGHPCALVHVLDAKGNASKRTRFFTSCECRIDAVGVGQSLFGADVDECIELLVGISNSIECAFDHFACADFSSSNGLRDPDRGFEFGLVFGARSPRVELAVVRRVPGRHWLPSQARLARLIPRFSAVEEATP